MTPRIRVDDLPADRHGAPNAKVLGPDVVRAATDAHDAALGVLTAVDAATIEVARLRNAVQQQCHL